MNSKDVLKALDGTPHFVAEFVVTKDHIYNWMADRTLGLLKGTKLVATGEKNSYRTASGRYVTLPVAKVKFVGYRQTHGVKV